MSHIPDPVHAAARDRPAAPALIAPHETVTYADLDRRVAATAERLRADGLGRGDRLAVYRPTDVDYLVLLLAAFRAGIVMCPLSTRQPAAAVPPLLERMACSTLIAATGPAWDGLRVIELDASASEVAAADDPAWHLDESATLVLTSGSTGVPKAVLHTLGNHVASARGLAETIPLGPGDRWLLDLPLYHVGGLAVLVRCVLAGAAVVLPAHGASAEDVIAERGVTHASFVATQFLRVLRGRPEALGGMKAILLGGSAIPPGLVADAVDRHLPIHTSYGLTEMASTVTATPPGASLAALQTAGAALPHREVTLADDGEILVRGATLFAGYADGEAVERPSVGEGWFPTGDLGAWVGGEGVAMLRVVGRKDNLFISGGENVQPEEIEAALGRVAGVRQAVVVPVEDAEFGQRPVAFVEAEDWAPEAWRVALADALATFKIPVDFYPWPDGERDGMKVSRTRLRQRAATLHERAE